MASGWWSANLRPRLLAAAAWPRQAAAGARAAVAAAVVCCHAAATVQSRTLFDATAAGCYCCLCCCSCCPDFIAALTVMHFLIADSCCFPVSSSWFQKMAEQCGGRGRKPKERPWSAAMSPSEVGPRVPVRPKATLVVTSCKPSLSIISAASRSAPKIR